MDALRIDPVATALLLCDLQNDFNHPDGAYAAAGRPPPTSRAARAPRAARQGSPRQGRARHRHALHPLAGTRAANLISPHLRTLRPFLRKGDFAPGGWGQQTVDELQPLDGAVGEGRLLGLLPDAAGMAAAQARGGAYPGRRHRHQWRRRLHGARRACARPARPPCWRMAAPPSPGRCMTRPSRA